MQAPSPTISQRKARRPEEWPLDTTNPMVWLYRSVDDVDIRLFDFHESCPEPFPRSTYAPNSAKRILEHHALECQNVASISFAFAVPDPGYVSLCKAVGMWGRTFQCREVLIYIL